MDLDDVILAVFCVTDEAVTRATAGRCLRQRGPEPTLAESAVSTMEVVGEYLGLEQDSAMFAYFRQHYAAHFCPPGCTLHRTAFVRQAPNLLRLKERLWQCMLERIAHDPTFAIIDSFPLPAVRPHLSRPPLPRRGGVWQGYAGAPDLLRHGRGWPLARLLCTS